MNILLPKRTLNRITRAFSKQLLWPKKRKTNLAKVLTLESYDLESQKGSRVHPLGLLLASNMFLVLRSILEKIVSTGSEMSLCNLAFLSFYKLKMRDWTTYFLRLVRVDWVLVDNQVIRVSHWRKCCGIAWSRWNVIYHSSKENSQWRKMCSLVSNSDPHRQQLGSTTMPQETSLCLTGNRFKWAVQKWKECFGIASLNHIILYQETFIHVGLIEFHVLVEENLRDSCKPIPHRYVSNTCWLGFGLLSRDALRLVTTPDLVVFVENFQPSRFKNLDTFAITNFMMAHWHFKLESSIKSPNIRLDRFF